MSDTRIAACLRFHRPRTGDGQEHAFGRFDATESSPESVSRALCPNPEVLRISLSLTGHLTRDPELRDVPDPASDRTLEVCQVRVAVRTRHGETVFVDLSEWRASGRAAAERLQTGSQNAFTGELRFREETGDDRVRQYLSAVGHIEFLDASS